MVEVGPLEYPARFVPLQTRSAAVMKAVALCLLLSTGPAAIGFASTSGFAQQETPPAPALQPGSVAPPLTVAEWIKGQPVASFEKGKVYVVEFWATWCGPCIQATPHLSKLQRIYRDKGVTVIGMTSHDERGNNLASVKRMVEKRGDAMAYSIAFDQERTTNEAWMRAAGRSGIPCSFLIDKQGRIAYIGHPMMLELPLGEVVAGTWDIVEGAKRMQRMEEAQSAIYQAVRNDPGGALEKLAAFEEEFPTLAHSMALLKMYLCLQTECFEEASVVGRAIVARAVADKSFVELVQVAGMIVDPRAELKQRDLDLALDAAKKSAELSKFKDAEVLGVLARVHFLKGQLDEAVRVQEMAFSLQPKARGMESALDEYRKARDEAQGDTEGEDGTAGKG